MLSWILSAHHVADVTGELYLVGRGAGQAVVFAVLIWLAYLACEPAVRRIRPSTLVSWTRLLNGGFGDAAVGRDVLLGATWAAGLSFFFALLQQVSSRLGLPAESPESFFLDTLLGTQVIGARILDCVFTATLLSLGALLLYLILRSVLRRELPTVLAFVTLCSVPLLLQGGPLWLSILVCAAFMGSYAFMLLRFGLLAACAGIFFHYGLVAFPLTTDLGSWWAGPTLTVLPLLALLSVLAFRTALDGSGLRRYLAGEGAASRPSTAPGTPR